MIVYYVPKTCARSKVLRKILIYDWDRDDLFIRFHNEDNLLEFKKMYDL